METLTALHFIRPQWLFALLFLAPLVWIGLRGQRAAGAWRKVCDAHLLQHVMTLPGGRARHWPLALLATAWLATCLALAGPAWERLPQPAFEAPDQRVFVLSLAASMDAQDVAPSRLTRAVHKLGDAFEAVGDGQAGLVIFAEEPYVVAPISDDPDVVASFLPVLETSLMPGRGARADRAIDEARALLEQGGATRGGIVLLTDGAGDRPEATAHAAREAARAGYPVSVLAIGSEEGAPVRTARGRVARSRLDLAALEAVAQAGEGRLETLTPGDDDILSVMNLTGTTITPSREMVRSDQTADAWRDMGIALVWLVALMAPIAFRRDWATALVLAACVVGVGAFAPPAAEAGVSDWMWTADQRAAQAFEDGRHGEAAELFEDPAWRAASLYREGHYEEAAEVLGDKESVDDHYNLGNALAQSGRLEEAVAAYDEVLAQDTEHEDARHNRELVAKLLEQQQQREQSQQQENQQQQQQKQQQQSQRQQGGEQQAQDEQQPGHEQQQREQADPERQQQGEQEGEDSSGSEEPGEGEGSQSDTGEESQDGSQDSSETGGSSGGANEEAQRDTAKGSDGGAEQDEKAGARGEESAEQSEMADAGEAAQPGSESSAGGDSHEPAGPDSAERQARANDASAQQPNGDSSPQDDPDAARGSASSMASQPLSEREQAVEQWLNRVSDDPGGLLREKLRRRYAQKRYLEATGGRTR